MTRTHAPAVTGDDAALLKALERCVRCGICRVLCPTYDDSPVEPLGARGRLVLLHALLSGRLIPSPLLNERIFSCILCGRCAGVCPAGVDIPAAMYRGRSLLRSSDKQRKYLRSFVRFSVKRPELAFRLAQLSQHVLLPFLERKGLIPLLPELPDTPLRGGSQLYKARNKKGRVAVFAGCSINYLYPALGQSLVHVLHRLGYEVVLPKGETCCGAPLRSLGLEEDYVLQAKKNYHVFSRLKVEAVLSLCPTCTMNLSKEYREAIGKGIDQAMDISVFFKDKLPAKDAIGRRAVYHDPCHLNHGLGVRREPRELIERCGLDLVEADSPGCCGMGGVFSLSFREMSRNILAGCAKRLMETDPHAVITSCPGCVMQLSRAVTDVPVLHLIELIEEAYCFRPERPPPKEKDPEKEPTLF
jgi:glycolate oxidase iron-sulfur subunit